MDDITTPTTVVTRISLDGPDWTCRPALGASWQWYVTHQPPAAGNSVKDAVDSGAAAAGGWHPAQVPGSVIGDLQRAGELDDVHRGRNSLAAEWTKERYWIYRRAFDLPDHSGTVVLEIDGVDPAAEVWVDGLRIGRVEGLHHQHRLALPTQVTGPGSHWLCLALEPAPTSEPQVGFTERVRLPVPRMGYGWDFCPRLVHQGVWKSVRLVLGDCQIAHLTARCEVATDHPDVGLVEVSTHLQVGRLTGALATLRVSVVDPDGRVIDRVESPATAGEHTASLRVDQPHLWWPHRWGGQPLYTVCAEVVTADELIDHRELRTGFRSFHLRTNPGAPSSALGYVGVINGQVVPLVGWNWVPADLLYGEIEQAKVEHLLDLAVASGAVLLRVWGGGLVESEHFLTAADERGLLIWQEFTQSSSGTQSSPATDDEFVATMVRDAQRLLPPRSHHPSLVLWCGGNELGDDDVPTDEHRSPVLAALRQVVAQLHPDRAWLPTSPSGPRFGYPELTEDDAPADHTHHHDVHGPWEHQGLTDHYRRYDRGHCLAHTEFGVEGMTSRRMLDWMMDPAHQWPPDRSNPHYRHVGEWWVNTPLLQQAFGHRLDDVEGVRRASQFLQGTGLAHALEADRRRWPHTSMLLPWQLNEPLPNAFCTSAVDWSGEPKAGYHHARRAFAARRVTLRTTTVVWSGHQPWVEVWLWSDRPGIAGQVQVRAVTAQGTVVAASTLTAPAGCTDPIALGVVWAPAAIDVLIWQAIWLEGDAVIDDERLLVCGGPDFSALLDLEPARLEVDRRADQLVVHHRGGGPVLNPHLVDRRPVGTAGWLRAHSDPRIIVPGESRPYPVSWSDGAEPGPIGFESWNADA